MALTEAYEICNLALQGIGENPITSALFTTPGNNKAALVCSTFYEPERDSLMEQHPWSFALKRVDYDISDFRDTITASTAANPVVVTGTDISVANIIEGSSVLIEDTNISGLDDYIFVATNVVDAAQTLELYKPDRITKVDGTTYSVATEGYIRLCPLSGYSYMYKLPTDLLRIWKLEDNSYPYEREGNYLLIDAYELNFRYISLVTDVSLFSKSFIDCLVTTLKAKFSMSLADKPERAKEFIVELEELRLPKAYRSGAIESLPKDNQERRNPSTLTSWQQVGH